MLRLLLISKSARHATVHYYALPSKRFGNQKARAFDLCSKGLLEQVSLWVRADLLTNQDPARIAQSDVLKNWIFVRHFY